MESRNWQQQQLRTRAIASARARAQGVADKEPLRRLLRPLELSVRLKNGGICTVDYSQRVDEMRAFYAYYLGVIILTRSKSPPPPVPTTYFPPLITPLCTHLDDKSASMKTSRSVKTSEGKRKIAHFLDE